MGRLLVIDKVGDPLCWPAPCLPSREVRTSNNGDPKTQQPGSTGCEEIPSFIKRAFGESSPTETLLMNLQEGVRARRRSAMAMVASEECSARGWPERAASWCLGRRFRLAGPPGPESEGSARIRLGKGWRCGHPCAQPVKLLHVKMHTTTSIRDILLTGQPGPPKRQCELSASHPVQSGTG